METTALRNLPIGIQNFESMRKDGYLYIDKTALIYKLATTGLSQQQIRNLQKL